ncbi:hypothetical protein [Mesorhizobium sp. M0859]|uniref:hypothetical protein n=1 Tax=Mesorhizobium sp. M0859 TaxID=2957014 RepID=UPI003336785B
MTHRSISRIWNASKGAADRGQAIGVVSLLISSAAAIGVAMSADATTAVFSALAAFVGTILTVWASGVRAFHADSEISEAQQRASEANERAAQLSLEAARLKQIAGWRSLTKHQLDTLERELRGQSFDLWVTTVGDDPEASILHEQIFNAMKQIGLNVHWFSGYTRASGVTISSGGYPGEGEIQAAFQKAGLHYANMDGPGAMSQGKCAELLVGSKPPPFFSAA